MPADQSSPKSLRDDLLALLAVQVIDTKIDRAKASIHALDTGSKTAAAYNIQKAASESLRSGAIKAQAEQKDAELRLTTIETKAAQVNKSMFSGTVTGSRELENLQKELDMLARQKDDAELKVLEAMEVSSESVTTAEGSEQALASLADQYRRTRAVYKDRHAELTAEIAAEEAERVLAAKAVSEALLKRYEALRPKKNGVGAAPLEADGVSCGGCHTQLNTTLVSDVVAARTVQICEYCSRILIPPPLV
jgi:predicted  nucleic acid-binding Zn-ribbon protein